MTLPEGTVALWACVTAPTVSPAPVMAVEAAACVRPTTFGTVTGCGPWDTVKATAAPGSAEPPAEGVCEMTLPEGTDAL